MSRRWIITLIWAAKSLNVFVISSDCKVVRMPSSDGRDFKKFPDIWIVVIVFALLRVLLIDIVQWAVWREKTVKECSLVRYFWMIFYVICIKIGRFWMFVQVFQLCQFCYIIQDFCQWIILNACIFVSLYQWLTNMRANMCVRELRYNISVGIDDKEFELILPRLYMEDI